MLKDDDEDEEQLRDDNASEKDGDYVPQEKSSKKSWEKVSTMLTLESSLTHPTSSLILSDPPSLAALLLLRPQCV